MKLEDLYHRNQDKKNYFLCDVCGYRWEVRQREDFSRKNLSLEEDFSEDQPKRCPSCGNLYISEL